MRRAVALAVAVAVAAVLGAGTPASGAEPEAVAYRPPVDAPVVDPFRPPPGPYAAGNRGVDYATAPGTPAGSPAPGVVAFAGPVGAGLHVVVLHADGIRTSLSFLASVEVHRGQRVAAGQRVGVTGARLHFGARAGDAYLDPLELLGTAGADRMHLVPDGERAMGSVASERAGLRRLLGGLAGAAAGAGVTAVRWARDGAVEVGTGTLTSLDAARTWTGAVLPVAGPPLLRVAEGLEEWRRRRGRCTPPGTAPPPPARRRRLVLVAGLGSSSAPGTGVDGVDARALGYDPADVVRFSYRGGTTAESAYGPADTQGDIAESGWRLRALLERLAAADPGVPVDVVAHSQGGLVARAALGTRPPPGVENLVTLATPHQGADLATAFDLVGRTVAGHLGEEALSRLGLSGIDPTSTSVRQLSEVSGFVRRLNAGPLPAGVRVTSIAARGDVVVPAPRAHLDGATNVVVSVDGIDEHPLLPAAPAATREMALALAGRAPTCEGLADVVADLVAGELIGTAETAAGLAAFVATGR